MHYLKKAAEYGTRLSVDVTRVYSLMFAHVINGFKEDPKFG